MADELGADGDAGLVLGVVVDDRFEGIDEFSDSIIVGCGVLGHERGGDGDRECWIGGGMLRHLGRT